ncbi:hypothetical protein CPB86DRAFT_790332 [Serendipita vermifera]|nr:hypothetical protein CPB86DRAFT_790332 [Serendipita vermifera]
MAQNLQISSLESLFADLISGKDHERPIDTQIQAAFNVLQVIREGESIIRQHLDALLLKQKLQAEEKFDAAKKNLEHIESEQLRMMEALSRETELASPVTTVVAGDPPDPSIGIEPNSTSKYNKILDELMEETPLSYPLDPSPTYSPPKSTHAGFGFSRNSNPTKIVDTGFAFGSVRTLPKSSSGMFGHSNFGASAKKSGSGFGRR